MSSNKWIVDWLDSKATAVGKHSLLILEEQKKPKCDAVEKLRDAIGAHYVDPKIRGSRLARLGARKTAALLKEHLPTSKRARSGDLGEILATEITECYLSFRVPIRRLRWKDGRNMPLRGDDIVGLARDSKTKRLRFLKGESKSRVELVESVVNEASDALGRSGGRPNRHSVLFVAERLREQGKDKAAEEIENAVLESFSGHDIEHLLFALTGSDPGKLLSDHLESVKNRKRQRHAVAIRIEGHGAFINKVYARP